MLAPTMPGLEFRPRLQSTERTVSWATFWAPGQIHHTLPSQHPPRCPDLDPPPHPQVGPGWASTPFLTLLRSQHFLWGSRPPRAPGPGPSLRRSEPHRRAPWTHARPLPKPDTPTAPGLLLPLPRPLAATSTARTLPKLRGSAAPWPFLTQDQSHHRITNTQRPLRALHMDPHLPTGWPFPWPSLQPEGTSRGA